MCKEFPISQFSGILKTLIITEKLPFGQYIKQSLQSDCSKIDVLKYFFKRGGKVFLEAANPAYEPIELNLDNVVFQCKLLAVWRKI